MKKLLVILVAMVALACQQGNNSESDRSSEAGNMNENVEENSGENISPQLEDSTNGFAVDTVSSSSSVEQQKQDNTGNE